jgi:heptosyltransferase-3
MPLKLMIVRPAALGDTLMLMPSLYALRHKAETTLVGRHPGIDFLAPYIHKVMDYEAQSWHTLFMDQAETVRPFSLPPPDLAILFHADPGGRIAPRLQTLVPGAVVKAFPGFPPADGETHVALYLADCLESSGCPISAEQTFQNAKRFPLLKSSVTQPDRGGLVFHPGSGGTRKNYAPEFWLDFIIRTTEYFSFPVTLLLGPAEEKSLSFFRSALRPGTEILFCPAKETLLSLLAQSRLYAGHDSGITHLAAMLGTPTLAFFRSTSAIQWRPLGPKVGIIQRQEGDQSVLEEALAQAHELMREAD